MSSDPMLQLVIDRQRADQTERWTIADPLGKLALRSRLPGAFTFDRATEALHRARGAGVLTADLLPLALSSSWLVNSALPSPVMAKWCLPPLVGYFRTLIGQLEVGVHELVKLDDPRIADAVAPLAIDGQGAGAISKVLAVLVPQTMVLMPDAAIAFAIDRAAVPEALDAQTAGVDRFVPMLTWFAQTVIRHEEELRELAKRDARARAPAKELEPAQLLDRLLWFESAGFRVMRGALVGGGAFHWLSSGEGGARRQAIVRVPVERNPDPKRAECINLEIEPDSPWKDAARAALDAGAP